VPHGETTASADGLELSEAGRLQSRAVGAELAGRVVSVITSPVAAAGEAAANIADATGAAAPAERSELSAPEGEGSLESTQEDGWAIIEAAKTELDADATLVLVTQEVNVRLLVCRALAMPLTEMGRFALEPSSMTTIEWRTQPRERLLVASLNEVCHLEAPAPGA